MSICLLINVDLPERESIEKVTTGYEVSFFYCNFKTAIQTFDDNFSIFDIIFIDVDFNKISHEEHAILLKLHTLILTKRPDLSVCVFTTDLDEETITTLKSNGWFVVLKQVTVESIRRTFKFLNNFFTNDE